MGGKDLAHEHLLHQLVVAQPAHGDKHQHHIAHGGGDALAQNGLDQFLIALETQIVEQKLHALQMTGVAHRLVVEIAHLALQGVAQRAQPARGVEGLVLDAIEREMLESFQRLHRLQLALVQGLAGVAVLIDQAVDAPGEVVFQLIGRKLGQRADAHLDVVNHIERLRQRMCRDADEAGREPALRHEGDVRVVGLFGELRDGLGGIHIFGEIEVVRAGGRRRAGDGNCHVKRQRVDDDVGRIQQPLQRAGVARIDHAALHIEAVHRLQGLRVAIRDRDLVVATFREPAGNGLADMACAQKN